MSTAADQSKTNQQPARENFIIAVSIETGKAAKAWRGKEVGNYDESKVRRYKIVRALDEAEAITRAEAIYQESPTNAAPRTVAAPTGKVEYFVCGFSDNLGKNFDGKPNVFTAAELAEERRKAKEATDGSWNVIVITSFEIEHY